eukprot:3273295-Lingulodinium_polyedra.AAC.1
MLSCMSVHSGSSSSGGSGPSAATEDGDGWSPPAKRPRPSLLAIENGPASRTPKTSPTRSRQQNIEQ